MQVKTGTAKWTENLSERASDRRCTARHAVIYLGVGLAGTFSLAANPAWTASDVVISQVYGGGGRSGAPFKQDFIELFNRGSTPVSLSGWTVQYASATGNTWRTTPLSGALQSGKYLLIELTRGNRGSLDLPAPDIRGRLSLASKSGKVALVNSTAVLTCGTPCLPNPSIQDLVGYGHALSFEGGPALHHSFPPRPPPCVKMTAVRIPTTTALTSRPAYLPHVMGHRRRISAPRARRCTFTLSRAQDTSRPLKTRP
jgi:hypothetical protein